MGCWSESCALSGMEIRHGAPCYVVILADEKVDRFDGAAFLRAPLLGKYDDYGGVEEMEASEIYGYPNGHSLDRDELEKLGAVLYLRADIFDKLGELKPECDYHHKTLEGYWGDIEGKIRTFIEQNYASDEAEDPSKIMLKMMRFSRLRSDVFGYRDTLKNASELLVDILDKKAPGTVDEFLKLYRRAYLLKTAEGELRHRLGPVGPSGPQHGGAEGLIQFSQWKIDLLKAEVLEWKIDNGEACERCHDDISEDAEWHDGLCGKCHAENPA